MIQRDRIVPPPYLPKVQKDRGSGIRRYPDREAQSSISVLPPVPIPENIQNADMFISPDHQISGDSMTQTLIIYITRKT